MPKDDPEPADVVPAVSLDVMRRAGLMVAPGGLERNRVSEEMSVVQHQVIRTLRSLRDSEGRCSRVILITSARPGEGKTFTALNLAASAAVGGGRPTVLVDVDGKRGSISELLGLADAPGVRLLASDPDLSPASLPIATELPKLSILPFGLAASSGSELPPGSMIVAAIQRLATALPSHVIVLDSPPCLSTSDPSNLAPVAGQVVMVVQAERTQRDEVEAALDLVEACPTLQLLLNQARMTSSSTFGAYGAYDVYRPYGARPVD
jgi:receptor protein-tyrosine kinase